METDQFEKVEKLLDDFNNERDPKKKDEYNNQIELLLENLKELKYNLQLEGEEFEKDTKKFNRLVKNAIDEALKPNAGRGGSKTRKKRGKRGGYVYGKKQTRRRSSTRSSARSSSRRLDTASPSSYSGQSQAMV
jgi:hypothetical protein